MHRFGSARLYSFEGCVKAYGGYCPVYCPDETTDGQDGWGYQGKGKLPIGVYPVNRITQAIAVGVQPPGTKRA